MNIRLVLVSKAEVHAQVRSQSPVVLHKATKIELTDVGFRIPSRDRELIRTATSRAYLCRPQTIGQTLRRKLETRFVDRAFIEYRSLSQTKSLLRAERAVLPRPKRESAGAGYVTAVLVFVPSNQRIVLVELIIEPRTEFDAAIRQRNRFGKR